MKTGKNATEFKSLNEAQVGDMVDEASLPESVRKRGGGWVIVQGRAGDFYVCTGCHSDGKVGFRLKEIRTGGWF